MSEEEKQELLVEMVLVLNRKRIRTTGPVIHELDKAIQALAKIAEKKVITATSVAVIG